MNIKSLLLSILITALGPMAANAVPVEMIVNGGFETGDFTGWAVTSNGTGGCDTDWVVNSTGSTGCNTVGSPIEGSFAAYNSFDGDGPQLFTVSQGFTVLAGITSASLSWLETGNLNVFTNERYFSVGLFDSTGTTLLENLFSETFMTGDTLFDWTAVSLDMTSILQSYAGLDVTLAFTMDIPGSFEGPGGWGLDAVSLQVEAAVPEPTTPAILGIGILAILLARRVARHSGA